MEIAPEDKHVVEEFVRDIRKLQKVQIPCEKPKEFFDLPGKIKMLKALPLLPVIRKWINVSSGDFSERFQNPLLREAISHFSSPVLFEMFVLSEMDLKRCGYPAIGSLEFSRRIEKKYLSCGGKIHYNSRVRKVIVQDNSAVGLELGDDQKRFFDRVVSAADGKGTIYDLLDGMYVDKTIKRQYGNGDLNPSKIQLSLGVKNTFPNWPRTVKVVLPAPYTISDGSKFDSFDVLIYNDVEGFAPDNCTLLVIQLDTKNGDYWSDLRDADRVQYLKAKEAVGASLIDMLGKRIDGIENNIEMVDVATPATYARFTGNWRGSAQGWSNENIFRPNPFRKQLPGLKGFFMVGQWVEPGGGVPNVFRSGRDLAQIICKMDKRQFVVD